PPNSEGSEGSEGSELSILATGTHFYFGVQPYGMLALTDAALAHIVIAANRLPTAAARADLLKRFAAAVDPGPPRKLINQRARSRKARQRRRDKVHIYRLELPDRAVEGMINALVLLGYLTEAEAQDQRRLERALAWWL